jgi:hypothetical protein
MSHVTTTAAVLLLVFTGSQFIWRSCSCTFQTWDAGEFFTVSQEKIVSYGPCNTVRNFTVFSHGPTTVYPSILWNFSCNLASVYGMVVVVMCVCCGRVWNVIPIFVPCLCIIVSVILMSEQHDRVSLNMKSFSHLMCIIIQKLWTMYWDTAKERAIS